MSGFRKPSFKPLEEPPGLTEFASGVAQTKVLHVIERAVEAPAAGDPLGRPRRPKAPANPFNIRLGTPAKLALERLAEAEQRSQNQILTRLIEPLLIDAASKLA